MFKSEIIGNLGADAEIKDNNGRKSIAFRMAHSEKYRDSNGQLTERTIWISVFKPAHDNDNLCQYLTKGTRVFVRGNLSLNRYQGKNGWEIGVTLNCTELEFCSSRQQSQQPQTYQPYQMPIDNDLTF